MAAGMLQAHNGIHGCLKQVPSHRSARINALENNSLSKFTHMGSLVWIVLALPLLLQYFADLPGNRMYCALGKKVTWRPFKTDLELEDESKIHPNSVFADDYYDDYELEAEGTRRNIFLFHTFEERMKAYTRLVRERMAAEGVV